MKTEKKSIKIKIRQNALSYRPLCSMPTDYISYKQIGVRCSNKNNKGVTHYPFITEKIFLILFACDILNLLSGVN